MSDRLPKEAYTELSSFQSEQKTVFQNAWTFAGTIHDFKEAGDFRIVVCGANRMIVVLGKDQQLRAFHNVCRHRGAELVDGPQGNCGSTMVCPYHRWTYGLDGALRGVPNRKECFPDLDRSTLGLLPAAIGSFKDLVFVNPNTNADFETWIAPLLDKAWLHDLTASDIKEAVPLVYDMKCNWKVYVENAID
jgi:phenylpropionate dioxygenase-like ring-hydroxylating dioxygenase large terminal subunit